MKTLILLAVLFSNFYVSAQVDDREASIKSYLKLNIWDEANSTKAFNVRSIRLDRIPRGLEFKGVVVEALTWMDTTGENILVLTESGAYKATQDSLNSGDEVDRAELNAYLFSKQTNSELFKRRWKLHDWSGCFGVDFFVGFYKQSLTITDIDQDGIAEVTFIYTLLCRGGMDPADLKEIMYEMDTKYAVRGSTAICLNGNKYGGERFADESLRKNKLFFDFMEKRWSVFECETAEQFRD